VVLPSGGQVLLVEMRRARGDPVLFVKPAGAGFEAGALPAYQDFDAFAVRGALRGGVQAPERPGLPCSAPQERARVQADAAVSDAQRAAPLAPAVWLSVVLRQRVPARSSCCRGSSGQLVCALVAPRDSS
jgi:hypothetical protein